MGIDSVSRMQRTAPIRFIASHDDTPTACLSNGGSLFPRVLLGTEGATAAQPEVNTEDGCALPFSFSVSVSITPSIST